MFRCSASNKDAISTSILRPLVFLVALERNIANNRHLRYCVHFTSANHGKFRTNRVEWHLPVPTKLVARSLILVSSWASGPKHGRFEAAGES